MNSRCGCQIVQSEVCDRKKTFTFQKPNKAQNTCTGLMNPNKNESCSKLTDLSNHASKINSPISSRVALLIAMSPMPRSPTPKTDRGIVVLIL